MANHILHSHILLRLFGKSGSHYLKLIQYSAETIPSLYLWISNGTKMAVQRYSAVLHESFMLWNLVLNSFTAFKRSYGQSMNKQDKKLSTWSYKAKLSSFEYLAGLSYMAFRWLQQLFFDSWMQFWVHTYTHTPTHPHTIAVFSLPGSYTKNDARKKRRRPTSYLQVPLL